MKRSPDFSFSSCDEAEEAEDAAATMAALEARLDKVEAVVRAQKRARREEAPLPYSHLFLGHGNQQEYLNITLWHPVPNGRHTQALIDAIDRAEDHDTEAVSSKHMLHLLHYLTRLAANGAAAPTEDEKETVPPAILALAAANVGAWRVINDDPFPSFTRPVIFHTYDAAL